MLGVCVGYSCLWGKVRKAMLGVCVGYSRLWRKVRKAMLGVRVGYSRLWRKVRKAMLGVCVGYSRLCCCACATSFQRGFTPLFVDSAHALWAASVLFPTFAVTANNYNVGGVGVFRVVRDSACLLHGWSGLLPDCLCTGHWPALCSFPLLQPLVTSARGSHSSSRFV